MIHSKKGEPEGFPFSYFFEAWGIFRQKALEPGASATQHSGHLPRHFHIHSSMRPKPGWRLLGNGAVLRCLRNLLPNVNLHTAIGFVLVLEDRW